MMRKNFWNHKLKNMMIIFLSAAVSFSSAAGMSLKSYAADEQQENEEETNDSSKNGDAGDNNDAEENNEAGENNEAAENNNNNENNENTGENASNDEAGNSAETDNSTSNNDDNNLGDETENNENAQSEENNGTPESAASAPVEPTKPEIEGELDNDKIRQYNQEAENYNQQVDDYNNAVDAEYEQALIDTEKRNEEIEANNQAELEKAEEIQQENERLQAQYEEDLAQYEKDLAMEERIKAVGYTSVEQYNNTINTYYNNPAKASVEKNADENAVFAIGSSYTIEEAAEKSGNMVKIHVEHNFSEIGISYSEDFEIDENDTITFNSAGAQLETTNPGYACFYMNTDEDHSMGYWMSAGSILMDNAVTTSWDWNCGDSHTLTYKDGKNHVNDITDIDMIYDYAWMPLKVYKTYNVPVEPTLNLVEYTPNILEKLAAPSKRSYLSHISLMDLLAEPEIIPTPDPEPVVDPEPVIIPEVTPVPEIDPIVTPIIPDPVVPTAPAPASEDTTDDDTDTTTVDEVTPFAPEAITIAETPVPMAAATEEGAVLGASRDTNEAAVLGASRDTNNEAAVLGARRASTEDTTNTSARIMILLLAAFTSITVIRKTAKNAVLR